MARNYTLQDWKAREQEVSGNHHGPLIAAHTNADGATYIHQEPSFPDLPRISGGSVLLWFASVLLAVLAVTQGFVSWHQQDVFILAAKHQATASALEAIGLDAAAVIFALLGVALAKLGRSATIERILVVTCAIGSMIMNLLGANLGSPRSVAVYVLPPLLFAFGADRFISVIRRHALGRVEDDEAQASAWQTAGTGLLYMIRFALAPKTTAVGMRLFLLQITPLPEVTPPGDNPVQPDVPDDTPALAAADGTPANTETPSRPVTSPRRGVNKQNTLIALAGKQRDLQAIPLTDVSKLATEIAPKAKLSPATARRVLLAHVRALQDTQKSGTS